MKGKKHGLGILKTMDFKNANKKSELMQESNGIVLKLNG